MANYNGEVAYSNGDKTGKDAKNPADVSCAGHGTYGYQYQCTELVKRFHNRPDIAIYLAKNYYYYPPVGFTAYENGGAEPPQPGDILVFSSHAGHVAIVKDVTSATVTIVEQNFRRKVGEATLTRSATNSLVRDQYQGSYASPVGWVRKNVSPSTQVILQPGPMAGKDLWTTSVFSYAGQGGPGGGLDDQRLRVGGWGDLYYSLAQFDLSTLPAAVTKVELQLYMSRVTGVGTTALYLDRVTAFWDWRTQGTGSDRQRLWWADRPQTVQWTPTTLPAPTAGQWYAIDITTLYNAWKAGTYPNYGVQLRPVGAGNNTWAEFESSNSTDSAHRPRLVVTPVQNAGGGFGEF